MEEIIEEKITVPKPNYNEWLKSLKQRTQEAAQEEKEELQWRQRYGKT